MTKFLLYVLAIVATTQVQLVLCCDVDLNCEMCLQSGCKYGKTRTGSVCAPKLLPKHRIVTALAMEDCSGYAQHVFAREMPTRKLEPGEIPKSGKQGYFEKLPDMEIIESTSDIPALIQTQRKVPLRMENFPNLKIQNGTIYYKGQITGFTLKVAKPSLALRLLRNACHSVLLLEKYAKKEKDYNQDLDKLLLYNPAR